VVYTGLPVGNNAALYTLLKIFSVSVFEKSQLHQIFAGSDYLPEQTGFDNQLYLFDFYPGTTERIQQ
jgi:hypothetical protein